MPVEQRGKDLRLHPSTASARRPSVCCKHSHPLPNSGPAVALHSGYTDDVNKMCFPSGDQVTLSASVLMCVSCRGSPMVPVAVSNEASQICWFPSRAVRKAICFPVRRKIAPALARRPMLSAASLRHPLPAQSTDVTSSCSSQDPHPSPRTAPTSHPAKRQYP